MTTKSGLLQWIDERFPLTSTIREHLTEYYAPKNFNFWYYFGSLALLVLVIQIVTGIFLVMHYKPDASLNASGIPVAFASVEYIMREVPGGWFIRYMHSTGRLGLLHRGLSAHVPRPALRLLPHAARTRVDLRRAHLPRPYGRGLHGLPAALGPGCPTGGRRSSSTSSRPSP